MVVATSTAPQPAEREHASELATPNVAARREARTIAPPEVSSEPSAAASSTPEEPTGHGLAIVKAEPEAPAKDSAAPETPSEPETSKSEASEPAQDDIQNPDDEDVEEPKKNTDENAPTSARQAELEELIAKGTYAVPINALKHRRHMVVFEIVLLLLVLAVAGLDVLLDMGTLSLPGVPHTNFLSDK